MDVQNAIDMFYKHNNITPYIAEYDTKYLPRLEERVKCWIDNMPDAKTRNAFLNLLTNYDYISERKYKEKIREAIEKIEKFLEKDEVIQEFGAISIDEVFFFVVESPIASGSDYICGTLKLFEISADKIVKNFSGLKKQKKNLVKGKVFVFIDDIFSSGATIEKHFKDTVNSIKECTKNQKALFLLYGLYVTELSVINFKTKTDSKQSLSEKYPMFDRLLDVNLHKLIDKEAHDYDVVSEYEEHLKNEQYKYMTDKYTYFMGFNENSLGISFYYETPNNTLSSFWLETYTNEPPFPRFSAQ